MQEISTVVTRMTTHDAGLDDLEAASKKWADHALTSMRGETLRHALDISRAMTEFASWVRFGDQGADEKPRR